MAFRWLSTRSSSNSRAPSPVVPSSASTPHLTTTSQPTSTTTATVTPVNQVTSAANERATDPGELEIKDLKVVGLPAAKRFSFKEQKYYVKVTVDANPQNSRSTGPSKTAEWTTPLDKLTATPNSRLKFEIFEAHNIRSKKLIESFEIDVQSVLRKKPVLRIPLNSNSQSAIQLECSIAFVQNVSALRGTTLRSLPEKLEQVIVCLDKLVHLGMPVGELSTPSKIALGVFSNILKLVNDQRRLDEDVNDLIDAIILCYDFLEDFEDANREVSKSDSRKEVLKRLRQTTLDCSFFIRECLETNFAQRLAGSLVSDRIKKTTTTFKTQFENLRMAWMQGSLLGVELQVVRMLEEIEKIGPTVQILDERTLLAEMQYSNKARYDQANGCLKDTRTKILDIIDEWINSSGRSIPRLCLLYGVAGRGKSTIANSIAKKYDEEGLSRLGSSFFFLRGDESNRQNLFSTISRNIADLDRTFRGALLETIRENISLRTSSKIHDQFDVLIKSFQSLTIIGPLVIVIDALDECFQGDIPGILSILSSQTPKLPENLRILLTTRPNNDILSIFNGVHVKRVNLDDAEHSATTPEIARFVETRLILNRHFAHTDLESIVQEIAEKSENLFLFAAIVCNTLQDTRGRKVSSLLEDLLAGRGLQKLYQTVLLNLFEFTETVVVSDFKRSMAFILEATQPLSMASLDELSRADSQLNEAIRAIVPRMGALLIGASDSSTPILPIHTTFRDFLTHESPWEQFRIDESLRRQARNDMALGTLSHMNKRLDFNMCKIKSSRFRNVDQLDLQKAVDKFFDVTLRYSCSSWSYS